METNEALKIMEMRHIIQEMPIHWSPRARWVVDCIRYPELRQTVTEEVQKRLEEV